MTRRRDDGLERALAATLENAVRAPYYARRFGKRWRRVRTVADLAELPLLDKATAIAHQRELVVGEAPAGFGVGSSGTSRAELDIPPLNVLNTPEELEAGDVWGLQARVDRRLAARGHDAADPFPGWTLVVIAVTHGLPLGGPGVDELVVPWMYDRNALYMLETVLGQPQPDGRRVTAMRVSVGALKCFTAWMLERGRDLSRLGVRLIGTNSFRVSPFWRELIEREYGARLFDNYSLSELATPATECEHCGAMHFGWPPLLAEVLDLSSGEPIERGVGRLVLTGLVPYVQKMPLVRYDTGDVVELGRRCRVTGQQSFRFLGRVRRGLVVRDGGRGVYALAPTLVQDVLEALPDTERNVHPLTTLGVVKSRDIGLPRWSVELGEGRRSTARLRFETRFDPYVFSAHAADLAARIRADILRLDAPTRGLVKRGELALEVVAHPPRTLTPPPDKYD